MRAIVPKPWKRWVSAWPRLAPYVDGKRPKHTDERPEHTDAGQGDGSRAGDD